MMSVPLHPCEGGCPIRIAVRGPCRSSSSPPHDTVTDDGEVVALLFPDMKYDLRQSARQSNTRHFFATPLLHRVEPRAKRPGPPRGLRCGEHENPTEQTVSFLTDVASADAAGARAHARR